MDRPGFSACTRFCVIVVAVMLVAGCTASTHTGSLTSVQADVSEMLEEIHASGKPVGFEQQDVSALVSRHLAVGTPHADVLAAVRAHSGTRVIEDSPATLIVRNDTGKAMLDPDARSVVMTFTFDGSGRLATVRAVQLKHQ